ncbi:MAG: hypothetical protein A2170_10065 [Deltaproteobacteria bacterium RBG_13_53_10]|nr:MAG: hypothetical protein A2170_10065 [Deltaproteobacteria bacterium RBG_13_53_10]
MFKRFAALAALVVVCSLAMAQDAEWTKTELGSFRVERFWEETLGDYTWATTIVTYKNTTKKTFTKNVTLRATIYDSQKKMVDTTTRSFFVFEYGPIKPDFEGTLKFEMGCAKGKAKSVSVRIDNAR